MENSTLEELKVLAKSLSIDIRGNLTKEKLIEKINTHYANELLPKEIPSAVEQVEAVIVKPALIVNPEEIAQQLPILNINTSSIRKDKLLSELRTILAGRASVEYTDDGNGACGFNFSGGTGVAEYTTINQPDAIIHRVARMFVARKAGGNEVGQVQYSSTKTADGDTLTIKHF